MIDIEKTLEDLKLLNALCHGTVLDDAIDLLKEQEEKIRQLRLALQILNGNGIRVDTEGRRSE